MAEVEDDAAIAEGAGDCGRDEAAEEMADGGPFDQADVGFCDILVGTVAVGGLVILGNKAQ